MAMEIHVIFFESFLVCSGLVLLILCGIWIGTLSNNSLSASFSTAFLLFLFFFHGYSQLFFLLERNFWFVCDSVAILLGHSSRERILIAPAYRSGRFLHASLIELHRFLLSHTAWSSRKCCSIHFLSLSAVTITILLRWWFSGNLKPCTK